MSRVFIFLLLATASFAADAIRVRVVGTPIEDSPVSLELRSGSDILDAVALVGGMTMSSSSRVMLTRGGEVSHVDIVATLRSPESPLVLKDGDLIAIPEHVIGTGYWQSYNSLLFECVIRRSHGLPMTGSWRKKMAALYDRARPAKKG